MVKHKPKTLDDDLFQPCSLGSAYTKHLAKDPLTGESPSEPDPDGLFTKKYGDFSDDKEDDDPFGSLLFSQYARERDEP